MFCVKIEQYWCFITSQRKPIAKDQLKTFQDDIYDYKIQDTSKAVEETDIANGRCTWLITTALEKGSPEQRKLLQEHYGIIDEEAVARVKNIYNEMDILTTHANSATESVIASTQEYIQRIPDPKVQNSLTALIYQVIDKFE